MNAMAMVTRCMVRQPPDGWASLPDGGPIVHSEHGDVAVVAPHQWEWPNLVIWSGSRHMVMLTVKE